MITCDLHARQTVKFFNFPVEHLVNTSVFIPYIRSFLQLPHVTFVAPDAGSVASAKLCAQHFDVPLVLSVRILCFLAMPTIAWKLLCSRGW